MFPNILAVSVGYGVRGGHWTCYELQFRVPVDDHTTQHYWFNSYTGPAHWEIPDELLARVPAYDVRAKDEHGAPLLEYIHGQDVYAWETQGALADRSLEHLGSTDRGVTMYRKMLQREMARSEAGGDPMCVLRDPAANERIDLPFEHDKDMNSEGFVDFIWRTQVAFSPIARDLIDVFQRNYNAEPALV